MARYRKINLCIHADERYRRLTPPPPCGQTLWWHLIAGEQTGIIPGLFKVGEAAFAEQLEWPLEGFREAFREVFREGMAKADWKARLVWVPKAIRHNKPESPNVVRSWKEAWRELPECSLKDEAAKELKAFLEGLGEAFREALAEAFGESGTGTGTGTGAGGVPSKNKSKSKTKAEMLKEVQARMKLKGVADDE